eukprot:m.101425 g.101425  ORF g.101425 m.101425 type:complete len:1017 (+) comp9062_c7_seq14:495-3545(+)
MDVVLRKFNGAPQTEKYKEIVKDQFKKFVEPEVKKVYEAFVKDVSWEEMMTLTLNIWGFMEEHLNTEGVITKFPARFFFPKKGDCKALVDIIGTAFKMKHEKNMRRFDFDSSSPHHSMEILLEIDRVLKEKGHFTTPTIYFEKSITNKQKTQLTNIAKRHGCEIATQQGDATHIIVNYPSEDPSEGPNEWVRPVRKYGSFCVAHFWYFPDSYNTILRKKDVDGDVEEFQPKPFYNVNAYWLVHTDKYNEFMNEDDYEEDAVAVSPSEETSTTVEEETQAVPLKNRRASSRKSTTNTPIANKGENSKRGKRGPSASEPKSKRDKRFESGGDAVEVATSVLADIPVPERLPKAVPVNFVEAEANASTKIMKSELHPVRLGNVLEISKLKGAPPEWTRHHDVQVLEVQQQNIVIPSAAAWFDYENIHEIEIRALPEFFNGLSKGKAPQVYMAYRNFMIDTFRLNPSQYLTATACRRHLVGDVCAIIRVHAFLEQWGLINYQVEEQSRPTSLGPPPTSHFHILGQTPEGMQPMHMQLLAKAKEVREEEGANVTDVMNLQKEYHLFVTKKKSPRPPSSSTNFGIRRDLYEKPSHDRSKPDWTDSEILALLEGVEMFSDDWGRVRDHVNTTCHKGNQFRSQDECVLVFVRLPIEDSFLLEEVKADKEPYPFIDCANPLMKTLSFLASVIEPSVAAEAARAAMLRIGERHTEGYKERKEREKQLKRDASRKEGEEEEKVINASNGKSSKPTPEESTCFDDEVKVDEEDQPSKNHDEELAGSTSVDSDCVDEDGDEKSTKYEKGDAKSKEATSISEADAMDEGEDSGEAETHKTSDAEATTSSTSVLKGEGKEGKETDMGEQGKKGDKESEDSKEVVEADEPSKNSNEPSKRTRQVRANYWGKSEMSELKKPVTRKDLQDASRVALQAAAEKARRIASGTERQILALTASLIDLQMRKMELKLKTLREFEAQIDSKEKKVMLTRQELLQKHARVREKKMEVEDALREGQDPQMLVRDLQITIVL